MLTNEESVQWYFNQITELLNVGIFVQAVISCQLQCSNRLIHYPICIRNIIYSPGMASSTFFKWHNPDFERILSGWLMSITDFDKSLLCNRLQATIYSSADQIPGGIYATPQEEQNRRRHWLYHISEYSSNESCSANGCIPFFLTVTVLCKTYINQPHWCRYSAVYIIPVNDTTSSGKYDINIFLERTR